MVNHLNPGESRHDTTTGVSWKSGVGRRARVEALSERIKGFPCGVCWRFPWGTALDV
ncbi:hypothetical protein HDV62DRAFT_367784 [Trichoderma sp. SZMC 28011]